MLIVHPKIILHINHNYYFYPSIRANNFRKYIILYNRDTELFSNANLRIIRNTGVHPKKLVRVCVNTPIDTNSPSFKLIILINRLNLI
jgi:hypothetical protein